MRVLVVDDDRAVRDALRRALTLGGYEVQSAEDGEQALEQVVQAVPDAVVLDVGLPGIDGLEVCRRLRLLGNRVPILILTARDAVADRIDGLDVGADDYMVKPFDVGELKARLRALLRRSGPDTDPDSLTFAELRLDSSRHGAEVEGQFVELTRTEYQLLELLMLNPRRVLQHGLIYSYIARGDKMSSSLDMDKPRVIISVRVSSEAQQEQGFGWDNQMRRLPELVDEQGWEIAKRPDGGVGIYDEGFALTTAAEGDDLSLEGRPVMQALLGELSVVQPTYLVCREQDRLHRSTLEWELIQHELVKANVTAVVQWPALQGAPLVTRLSESKDQAFASIQAVFAQLQKADMKAKMGAGRRERTAQGLPWGGRRPYGYARLVPKGPFVVNEGEAEVYRQIMSWAIEGLGARAIANRLTRQGIPTMSGKGRWQMTTIKSIVSNQAQLGMVRARRDGEVTWVPATDQPALISRELWEQAQAVISSRKTPPNNRRRAPLAGLLKCSACGYRLKHLAQKKRNAAGELLPYPQYQCTRNPACTGHYSISESKALAEIAIDINELLQSGTHWVEAPDESDIGDVEGRVSELQAARETAHAKVKRANTAYVDAPEETAGIALEELHRRREVLKSVEEELAKARQGYAEAMTGPTEEVDMQALRELLQGWESLANNPKRMMLETIIDYVDVLPKGRGKRLDIHWLAAPVVPAEAATLGS